MLRYKIHKNHSGIEIRRSICINPELFTSVEKLEGEVLRDSPCVGIADWRGIGSRRTHFFLPSSIPSPFSIRHEVPISQQLLQLAQEFMSESTWKQLHICSYSLRVDVN